MTTTTVVEFDANGNETSRKEVTVDKSAPRPGKVTA